MQWERQLHSSIKLQELNLRAVAKLGQLHNPCAIRKISVCWVHTGFGAVQGSNLMFIWYLYQPKPHTQPVQPRAAYPAA